MNDETIAQKLRRKGFAIPPENENRGLWVVLDEEGWPIHCAGWPEACHEHINDAIEIGITDAAKWKVRRAELVPNR